VEKIPATVAADANRTIKNTRLVIIFLFCMIILICKGCFSYLSSHLQKLEARSMLTIVSELSSGCGISSNLTLLRDNVVILVMDLMLTRYLRLMRKNSFGLTISSSLSSEKSTG